MDEVSDILCTEIKKLDTLTGLLMTNDGSMQIDPDGIASLLIGIVDGLKFAHTEIRDYRER